MDSHQHSHNSPSILKIVLPILEQYQFEDLRLARNIPKSNITGVKRVVKRYTNIRIQSYNKKHSQIVVTGFGSMSDVENESNLSGITEMMIHPIMNDGIIQEAFSDESIEVWWKNHEHEFELL